MSGPRLTRLVQNIQNESAFSVLAAARALKAKGKDVVELEIGDSPFPSPSSAKASGIAAIERNQTGYCPSLGLPSLRATAAEFVEAEFGIEATADQVAIASGAKPFQQYFAETFLEPDDGVLIFSPQFPTYVPNLLRRGARAIEAALGPENQFRPRIDAIERFLATDAQPRAIILNSPHNPTGGVATGEDLDAIADLIRGTDIVVFSDEPYCHMVWRGRHESLLARAGMVNHVVAAYTFSKSYSMSGWRMGFCVAHPDVIQGFGKLINTSVSCAPPFVQAAAEAALKHEKAYRDEMMGRFRRKVETLAAGLARIPGIRVEPPAGTFYVFPDIREICSRLKITSHGFAMYLLEGADDAFGVACLGGECFGAAGQGFLRFSCAEEDDRIAQAVAFLPEALQRGDRIRSFLDRNPEFAAPQA